MPPKIAPRPKFQAPSLCKPQAVVTVYITPPEAESTSHAEISSRPPRTIRTTEKTTSAENPIKFIIHKDFICYYSPFFKAAFNGNFLESKTQEMTLEADVVAFGIVVSWFYTKKLVNSYGKTPNLVILAQSWILAEYFKMPKLQNQIIVEIHGTLLYINDAGYDYEDFENFAKIACNHGNGENQLVEVGAWAMAWAETELIDHLSDDVPLAMCKKALRLTKNGPSWVTAQVSSLAAFCVNESTAAGN